MSEVTFEASLRTSAFERQFDAAVNRSQAKLNKSMALKPVNAKQFTQPLGKISRSVSEFDKSMEAANARVLAFGASTGVFIGVQRALGGLVTTTIEVEKAMKDINVVLNLNTQNLDNFKKSLFDVARNTGQSFAVVAEAAKELSRQGLGTTETLNRINSAMILSRQSGLDATESVEALTAAMNSYTKSALSASEIVNKLATVDAAFAVSSADLAKAVQRVGSSAEDAGVSFSELVALVTSTQQITSRGGAVIGNAFKTIFTRLSRPKVLDQLEQLGVAVRTAKGETLPAVKILESYVNVYDRLSPAIKSSTDEMIGSVFQINQLKALVKDLSNEYGIYNSALDIANNKTTEAINRNIELNTTLDATIKRAGTTVQEFAANIGQSLVPTNVKTLTEFINFVFSVDAGTENGNVFAKGFVRGVTDFLSGPGLVAVAGVITGLVKGFFTFAKDSFAKLADGLKFNNKILEVNQQITGYLEKENGLYDEILRDSRNIDKATRAIADNINRSTLEAKKFKNVVNVISGKLTTKGISVSAFGPTIGKTGKGTGSQNPSFAPSPLSQAIERERMQTGLPTSQIKVGQDSRLISPQNPAGIGVYNTRDEPLGLGQGIEREKALGNDPKKAGLYKTTKIPIFAQGDAPFTNPIGSLIGSETKGELNKLRNKIQSSTGEVDNLEKAIKKFYTNTFKGKIGNSLEKVEKEAIAFAKRLGLSNAEIAKVSKNATSAFQQSQANASNIDRDFNRNQREREGRKSQLVASRRESRLEAELKIKNAEIEKASKIQNAEIDKILQKGKKSGPFDFTFGAARADRQLAKIKSPEANLAREELRQNFGDKVTTGTFIASLAAPVVAGVISEGIASIARSKGEEQTTGTRATIAGVGAVGNIASFAATGAAFGGPTGAAIGALGGAALGLANVFKELNDVIPEFRDELRKTNEEITSINDTVARIQSVEQKLSQTTNPEERLNLQNQLLPLLKTASELNLTRRPDGTFDTKSKLSPLEAKAQFKNLTITASDFKKDPANKITKQTLGNLFGSLQFDGDRINEIFASGEDSRLIDDLKNFQKSYAEYEERINKNLELASTTVSRYEKEGFQIHAKVLEGKRDKSIISFFQDSGLFSENQIKELIETGGKDSFKFFFDQLSRLAESTEALKVSNEKTAAAAIDYAELTRKLNTEFEKLNKQVNLLTLLGSSQVEKQGRLGNARQTALSGFTAIQGLLTSDKSLAEFQSARRRNEFRTDASNQQANNINIQRQSIATSIESSLKALKAPQADGVKASLEVSKRLREFLGGVGKGDFSSQLEELQGFLINTLSQSDTRSNIFLSNEANRQILEKLVNEIEESDINRQNSDKSIQAVLEAQLATEKVQLSQQQKLIDTRKAIGFGGGIEQVIGGNLVKTIQNNARLASTGNSQERLSGLFELAKISDSLNLGTQFKDQIVKGLAEANKAAVRAAGGSISDTDARRTAEIAFDNAIRPDRAIEDLNNAIGSFEDNLIKNINDTFTTLDASINNLTSAVSNDFGAQIAEVLDLYSRKNKLIEERTSLVSKSSDAVLSRGIASGSSSHPSVKRILEIDKELKQVSNQLPKKRNDSPILGPVNLDPVVLKAVVAEEKKRQEQQKESISLEQVSANSIKERNKELENNIKTERESINVWGKLSSVIAQNNARDRQELLKNRGITGGKAFADNLFDSLQANTFDYQNNLANFGVELGSEVKTSFKGAISSMTRDIGNFRDAAQQAFQAILNKVTDFGVSQFVDQGLSIISKGVLKRNSGGPVTGGSGVRDDVPALLTGGEYVIKKSVVDKLGTPFFEGLNRTSGSAATTLKNAFEVNSTRPKSLADGQNNIDANLSAFALANSNNPQNQVRFETETQFLNYIESLRGYEADIQAALNQYKKQKKNIITQGFLSAAFNLAGFGLSQINAPKGLDKFKANSVFEGSNIGFRTPEFAKGGFSKDTVPALLQGGEYVMSEKAVKLLGKETFDRLNAGKITPRKFATGGLVESANRNFISPTNTNESPSNVMPIVTAINELKSIMQSKEPSEASSPSQTNNIVVNVNVDNKGQAQTSTQVQSNRPNEERQQNAKQLGNVIQAQVYQILAKESKPNGLLSRI